MRLLIINTLFFVLFLAISQNISHAATIIVNDDQDLAELDGNCDLRDAILAANVNLSVDGCTAGQQGVQDLIVVQVPGPIQLNSALPVFSSMLITTTFNADPVEIKAAADRRIMRVAPNSTNDNDFTMINFKMTGGQAGENNHGGAIYFTGSNASLGAIELNGMIFENNQAHEGGALSFNETRADSIRIADSTFIANQADVIGGAVSGFRVVKPGSGLGLQVFRNHFENNTSGATAGALFMRNEGTDDAVLSDNHFISNTAAGNIGAVGLGAIVENQTYHLDRNLFLYNQAGGSSGGLEVGFSSIVYVEDSLFAFNSAQRGGAVTSLFDDALLRLSSSTLIHNSASSSGDNIYIFSTGRLIPSRNIIAYPVNGDNCAGTLGTNPPASSRDNITDDGSCELLNNVSNTLQIDPELSGFAAQAEHYPGFGPTVNSPAIDSTEVCNDQDLMQRSRPTDGDDDGFAFCDVGAIEAPAATDLLWADSFGF